MAVGSGSVDAVFSAISKIVAVESELLDFDIHAVTEGVDALGEVSVRIAPADAPGNGSRTGARPTYAGYGTDTDIIVASAKAYLAALNRMLAATEPAAAPPPVIATAAVAAAAAAPVPYSCTEEPFDSDYTVGIP